MKSRFTVIAGVVAAVVLITLLDSLFIVHQTQQAIVIQFGNPKRVIQDPGLKVKVPFIQRVVFYDNRLLGLDPPEEQVLLADKKRIVVDTFSRFRIVNPLLFYQSVLTEEFARSRLSDAIVSSLRDVLGKHDMKTMLSEKRTDIMAQIEKAKKEIEREKKEQIANEQETASFEQVQQEEVQQTEEQDLINQQNDEMVEQNYIN